VKKFLVISFLIIALLAIGYLTFIKAVIEIAIGSIFLIVFAIAVLVLWIMWKSRKE
tara:strand:+ start:15446 stop:15613 length:168 start_codon:yes stop_codon:yes gene_type:complete